MDDEACDEDIYNNGVFVTMLSISKEEANSLCKAETERTGVKHDWRYCGGRVRVLASKNN